MTQEVREHINVFLTLKSVLFFVT